MKITVITTMALSVFGASLILTAPVSATTAIVSPQIASAAKCINLSTGIARNLPGTKCPKGWVPNGSSNSIKKRTNYLATARGLESDLYLVEDNTLFGAGRAICQVLDRGGNFGDIIETIANSDLDSGAGAAVVVAAINSLCPGHETFLANFLDSR